MIRAELYEVEGERVHGTITYHEPGLFVTDTEPAGEMVERAMRLHTDPVDMFGEAFCWSNGYVAIRVIEGGSELAAIIGRPITWPSEYRRDPGTGEEVLVRRWNTEGGGWIEVDR